MKYFEETGYNKDQNKKDITWEEVKNLPVYVMTDTGNLWHGEKKVSEDEAKKPCYIVRTSSRDVALYFFEKATLGEMTGVKLHLMQEEFYKAKKIYAPCLNKEHWVFITPDWKTYDIKGKPIKIKELTYFNESYAPSHHDFDTFRTNAHDLRIIGQFDDRISSEQMLSPASVEILKEAPYYTIEVAKESNGKYTIKQCLGKCNINPTPEIVKVLKQWAVDTGKIEEDSIKDNYRPLLP